MSRRTAINRTPSTGSGNSKLAKTRAQFNKAIKAIKKYDQGTPEYEKAVATVNKLGPTTKIGNWQNRINNALAVTSETKFMRRTPEERAKQMETMAGLQYKQMMEQAQQFDPNRPFAGYEMGFGEARDKAYNDVMAQFNRSMEPEFQRQNAEFQQRMADQGLDPNSPAYQAQYKAMADAQSNARLNAQSQASQQAYQVQEQAFGQGYKASMTPFEQWQASNQPWMVPTEQRGNVNLANVQGGWQQKIQNAQNAAAIQQANIAASTSRANTEAQIAAENERFARQQMGKYPQGPKPKKPTVGQGLQNTAPTGVLIGSQGR